MDAATLNLRLSEDTPSKTFAENLKMSPERCRLTSDCWNLTILQSSSVVFTSGQDKGQGRHILEDIHANWSLLIEDTFMLPLNRKVTMWMGTLLGVGSRVTNKGGIYCIDRHVVDSGKGVDGGQCNAYAILFLSDHLRIPDTNKIMRGVLVNEKSHGTASSVDLSISINVVVHVREVCATHWSMSPEFASMAHLLGILPVKCPGCWTISRWWLALWQDRVSTSITKPPDCYIIQLFRQPFTPFGPLQCCRPSVTNSQKAVFIRTGGFFHQQVANPVHLLSLRW
jgi:hypothetical protein